MDDVEKVLSEARKILRKVRESQLKKKEKKVEIVDAVYPFNELDYQSNGSRGSFSNERGKS